MLVAFLTTGRVETRATEPGALRRVLEPVATGNGIALLPGRDGDVWWITRERVERFVGGDPERRETVLDPEGYRARFGRHFDPLVSAHVDAGGDLWVGSRRGEVLLHHDGAWLELSNRHRGPTDSIRSIATRSDTVYVAGHGLWRGRRSGEALVRLGPFASQRVDLVAASDAGLAVAAEGQVWRRGTGGWHGVWRSPRGSAVHALAFDAQGDLWVGADEGLVRVRASGRVEHERFDGAVTALALPASGASFVGTRGAGLFARYADSWRRIHAAGDLEVSHVSALASGPQGSLWVAMGENGLYRTGPSHGDALADARL